MTKGEMERWEGREVPPQSGLPERKAPCGNLLPALQSGLARQTTYVLLSALCPCLPGPLVREATAGSLPPAEYK